MIASCLVNQKTSRRYRFDYLVPDQMEIEPLTLVQVSFLNKKTAAVVLELKDHSDFAKKEIIRKLSDGAIFTKNQLALSDKIAYEFLSDPSSSLFSFLPDFNLKDLKRIKASIKESKPRNFKIGFVEATFWERFQYYAQSLSKEGQNLIILPEISSIQEAEKKFKKLDPSREILLWHSILPKHSKAKVWQKILSGDPCIIISSRHGLFLPFTNLKTICLDEPFSFGYFEDQDPRYNAYQASKIVQKNYNCNLILGDSLCPPSIFVQVKKGIISRVKLGDNLKIYKAPELPNSLSSEHLLDAVQKAQRILITGFFKDFIRVICKDCKNPLICEDCQNEFFSDKDGSCLKCLKQPAITCSNCKSTSLIKVGFGATKIKEGISSLFRSSAHQDALIKKITICPIKDLKTLEPIYDLAVFPYLELYNNYPAVNIKTELIRSIREMPSLAVSKVFLLTKNNNILAHQILNHKWDEIILDELSSRKEAGIPPFTRYFEVQADSRQIAKIEKAIPDLLFKSDKQKYSAFIPHKLIPQFQSYFAKEALNTKARLDSPDFS